MYIFDPLPQLRVHMSKTLTATYFYENFVPLLLLERLADVLRPPGLAFLASPPSNGLQNQSHELG